MSERTYAQAYDDGDTDIDPTDLYICRICDRPYKGRAMNYHMVRKHGYKWLDQFNVYGPEADTQGTDLPSERSKPASGHSEAQSGAGEKGRN